MTAKEQQTIDQLLKTVSDLREENRMFRNDMTELITAINGKVEKKHTPVNLEADILSTVQLAMNESIKSVLSSYNFQVNNEKKAPVRQIKFRGLRVDGEGWVYGVPYFLNIEEDEPEDCVYKACIITGADWDGTCGFMSPDNNCFIEVIPETVGQFIANNGKQDFYIGDIVINPYARKHTVVIWDNMPCLHYIEKGRVYFAPMTNGYLMNKTVIGNIHEGKETN